MVGPTNKKAAPGRVSADVVPRGSRSMLTSFLLSDDYPIPMPKLGGSGSGSGSGVGSGSGRGCGIFPRAGAMILSSLCGTNISARLAAPGVRGRGAAGAASGADGDACALAGSVADGAGLGSGGGAACVTACGFAARSATGCGLCGCGEDAPHAGHLPRRLTPMTKVRTSPRSLAQRPSGVTRRRGGRLRASASKDWIKSLLGGRIGFARQMTDRGDSRRPVSRKPEWLTLVLGVDQVLTKAKKRRSRFCGPIITI